MNRLHPISLFMLLPVLLPTLAGCSEAECATPDYTRAECRVLAENDFARLRTSDGAELRFRDPATDTTLAPADDDGLWTAAGLIRERGGTVEVRVAHPGDFLLSLEAPADRAVTIDLSLSNVHPQAELFLGPTGSEQPVDANGPGTRRRVDVILDPGERAFIRGHLPCEDEYRILVLADVQTNPTQFARILDRMQQEQADAEAVGQTLAGVLMAGDLTESSTEDEFRIFADLLEPVRVPFALTAGNHDIYESILPYYNQNFGPGNYGFNVCDTRVAMLDTGSGAIASSVLGQLPTLFDRQGADFLVTAMHHPPYAALTSAGWSEEDLAMITLGEFAYQGGDLVIAGHAHMLRDFLEVPVADTILREMIVGTAGAWQGAGPPLYGYVRLTFEPQADAIWACFVEVPPPGAPKSDSTRTTLPFCQD
ncbi:MAG: metallophosphoesterase [Myxococcales bacterium]|nr:metallophosphoesterase [Myxococcales bacterium]